MKFEERRRSNNKDLDLELLLNTVKQEIDSLLQESPNANKSKRMSCAGEFDSYLNDDMKMLIESYEKCSRRINELNEKSHIKGFNFLKSKMSSEKILFFSIVFLFRRTK